MTGVSGNINVNPGLVRTVQGNGDLAPGQTREIVQNQVENQNLTPEQSRQLVDTLSTALNNALNQNRELLANQNISGVPLQNNQPTVPPPAPVSREVQEALDRSRRAAEYFENDIFKPLPVDPAVIRGRVGKRFGLGGVSIDQPTIDAITTIATTNPNSCTITQSHFLTPPATRFNENDTNLSGLSKAQANFNWSQLECELGLRLWMLRVSIGAELPNGIV